MPKARNRSNIVFAKDYPSRIAWHDSLDVYRDLVVLFEYANKNFLLLSTPIALAGPYAGQGLSATKSEKSLFVPKMWPPGSTLQAALEVFRDPL